MRIYVAGPMKDRPNNNREAFIEACKVLREYGYDVVAPHELTHDHGQTHAEFMREDLTAMLTCEAIVMLAGWPTSRGARDELHAACSAGLTVYTAEYDQSGFIGITYQGWNT